MSNQKRSAELTKKSLKIKAKMATLQQEYNKINNIRVTEYRFGNFKVKLSDMKVDISPVATAENMGQVLTTHTYRIGSDVFMAFYMALSKYRLDPEKKTLTLEKTVEEIAEGHKIVSYFINSLFHLSMFLTDSQFANEYVQLVTKTLEARKVKEVSKEADDEIVEEMRKVQEAQDVLDGKLK